MTDDEFIQFMHSGSPQWKNEGLKKLEDFKVTDFEVIKPNELQILKLKYTKLLEYVEEVSKQDIFSVMNHYDTHLKAKKVLKEIGAIDV